METSKKLIRRDFLSTYNKVDSFVWLFVSYPLWETIRDSIRSSIWELTQRSLTSPVQESLKEDIENEISI